MKKIKKIVAILLFANLLALGACTTTPSSSNTNDDISTSSSTIDASGLSIQLDGQDVNEASVYVGENITLKAVVNPSTASQKVTWTTSSDAIAIVNDGVVTGVSDGTAIIKATTENNISKNVFVEVSTKPGQTGVGSGLSPDDPIYIGNEGEDEPLEIYFIETMRIYSDAIFIKKGNVEILIDAGYEEDGTYISSFIDEHCEDGTLDALMLSHSDGDHIDGLTNALQNVENISLMVDYGGMNNGKVGQIRTKYIENEMQYHSAYDSVNFLNGGSNYYYLTDDFYFQVLDTKNYITSTDTNASNPSSLAVIFYYKDFTFFTGGDLTTASEGDLMNSEILPEVTLFKAHHHGSHGSNSQSFLNEINPKFVAISASRASGYGRPWTGPSQSDTYNLDATTGHPADEAVERIFKAPRISENHNVYWNAINGTMKFTTYGEDDCTFEGSPTRKGYYDLTLTDGTPVWNSELNDWENKVTGEENLKFCDTKAFKFRGYESFI